MRCSLSSRAGGGGLSCSPTCILMHDCPPYPMSTATMTTARGRSLITIRPHARRRRPSRPRPWWATPTLPRKARPRPPPRQSPRPWCVTPKACVVLLSVARHLLSDPCPVLCVCVSHARGPSSSTLCRMPVAHALAHQPPQPQRPPRRRHPRRRRAHREEPRTHPRTDARTDSRSITRGRPPTGC